MLHSSASSSHLELKLSLSLSLRVRNKKRLFGLLAAGAAGGATAYCLYKYWYTSEEESSSFPSTSGLNPNPQSSDATLLLHPHDTASVSQLDAEAHLQHHFESILKIADGTTLPSLLGPLGKAILSATHIDDHLSLLKKGGHSADEKIALWNKLAVSSLTALIASLWALVLLDIQVHSQLSILGRQLYLETALMERQSVLHDRVHPRLSSSTQERFLSCAEYLAKEGYASLVHQSWRIAEELLCNMSLDAMLDAEAVRALVAMGVGKVSPPAAPGPTGGWAPLLLPTSETLKATLRCVQGDDRAARRGAEEIVVDAEAMEAMVGETWKVLSSEKFDQVVTQCTEKLAMHIMVPLGEGIAPDGIALAKAVPLFASAAKTIFDPAKSEALTFLRDLEEGRLFSGVVYASGAP